MEGRRHFVSWNPVCVVFVRFSLYSLYLSIAWPKFALVVPLEVTESCLLFAPTQHCGVFEAGLRSELFEWRAPAMATVEGDVGVSAANPWVHSRANKWGSIIIVLTGRTTSFVGKRVCRSSGERLLWNTTCFAHNRMKNECTKCAWPRSPLDGSSLFGVSLWSEAGTGFYSAIA